MTTPIAASDPYTDLLVGSRLSVDCALQTMIEMSGNSAADLLMARLGSSTINARIKSEGLTSSAITADTAYTSPADIATLLESIARGTAINSGASQRMLDMPLAQQHNDRLPVPLPLDVRIAHKTGELANLRNDAGIVFAPSGTYVLVVLVENAPSQPDARSAIVDVSHAVYAALEPKGAPTYMGMPPRLAQQVFQLPDAQGRLALLGDPRTETAPLPAEVRTASEATDMLRLRPEVFADLISLQHSAMQAGSPFWVRTAFEQPTDAEARYALPTEWIQPCALQQPQRVADLPVTADDLASAHARQVWLGTVLSVTDSTDGSPTTPGDTASPAWRWLTQHAADFGFVPALPETPESQPLGHEPWTLRWVGRDMAARLQPLAGPDYPQRATRELERAEADLSGQQGQTHQPPAWGLSDNCWTIATSSTRGCASRWYFLGLPLS